MKHIVLSVADGTHELLNMRATQINRDPRYKGGPVTVEALAAEVLRAALVGEITIVHSTQRPDTGS